MIWGEGKARVADVRWWARIHDLLDDGQVFVVQVGSERKDWTAAEVKAVIDSGAVVLDKPGTKANVVEIVETPRRTLPSERRKGGRSGRSAGQ